jgi:YegS/Rv2252/BmrU family lipid kinase
MAAMIQIKSAALIVNAMSRTGEAMFEQARDAMRGLPYPVDAHAVHDPEELEAMMAAILAKKPDLVVLGGGDGTISGLVDHLVGKGVVLGVLPLGTANSFARTLGIPLEVEGAVEVLRSGEPKRIDLGMIDHDYFANCAAIGLSPQIAETVPHKLKRWFGRAGYLAWAAIQYMRFEPFTLVVTDGGRERRVRTVEVRISNGSYHGGTELVEEASLDSGEIVIQAVTGRVKRRLIANWGANILRLESRKKGTVSFRGKAMEVRTDPPLPISIDGEVLAKTPVMAKVAAGVIYVMAPVGR